MLRAGAASNSTDTRRDAIGALGLITGNSEAESVASHALADPKTEVRAAAAASLGNIGVRRAIPALVEALNDKEPMVVMAAANSLVRFKDERGYDIYYEVLTGKRKAGKGVIASEMDTLRNPRKLAELGFEEGIGFLPFGGMGLEVFRTITKNTSAGVRAAAAKVLASDPEKQSQEALADAATDNDWRVRIAAIDAIAERGDPRLMMPVVAGMQDTHDVVRFTAAAAVVRLSGKNRKR